MPSQATAGAELQGRGETGRHEKKRGEVRMCNAGIILFGNHTPMFYNTIVNAELITKLEEMECKVKDIYYINHIDLEEVANVCDWINYNNLNVISAVGDIPEIKHSEYLIKMISDFVKVLLYER